MEAAELATRMRPDLTSAWFSFGVALCQANRAEEGLAAYDQAIIVDHRSASAHQGRGIALRILGRYEDALASDDEAIALDPRNSYFHNNRGVVLRAMGRDEDALASYDQAIALDSRLAGAHENKGVGLAAVGDFDQALAELGTATSLDPDGGGEGKVWAGAILWHQRESARARDLFELAEGRVTGCTPFHTAEMEAIALCGKGQLGLAEERLLDAFDLRVPGDREVSRGIYKLLCDPPLPGIERLRAIVER